MLLTIKSPQIYLYIDKRNLSPRSNIHKTMSVKILDFKLWVHSAQYALHTTVYFISILQLITYYNYWWLLRAKYQVIEFFMYHYEFCSLTLPTNTMFKVLLTIESTIHITLHSIFLTWYSTLTWNVTIFTSFCKSYDYVAKFTHS